MKFRQIFNDFHPLTKLVFDILLVIVSAFAFFFIGTFLLSLINGMSVKEIIQINSDINGDIFIIKQGQLVYSLSLFMIPALIISLFFDKNPMNFYGLNKSSSFINYINVIILVIVSLPIVNFLAHLNSNLHFPNSLSFLENMMTEMEEKAQILTNRLLTVSTINQLLLNIFLIALIPAIGEELFFRGLIQKHLIEWLKNSHIAIIITAIFFSAFHFQFLTFLPRLFLGIILGYLFVWSKSLWLSIVAHFSNNAIAIITYYIFQQKGLSTEKMEAFGSTHSTIIFALYSTIIFLILFYFIYKNEKHKNTNLTN